MGSPCLFSSDPPVVDGLFSIVVFKKFLIKEFFAEIEAPVRVEVMVLVVRVEGAMLFSWVEFIVLRILDVVVD